MQRPTIDVLRLPLDRLPDPLPIPPHAPLTAQRPIRARIQPPGSKSLTNRVLPLAALGSGVAIIEQPLLDADDAQRMIAALRHLGVRIEHPTTHATAHRPQMDQHALRVHGVEGRWRQPTDGVTLDLGNAGTATRFLAALACLADPLAGPITIDGNPRMRERPIGQLVDMLRSIGVAVDELGHNRCPPIRVHPAHPLEALHHSLTVGPTASSQFVSAMLMLGAFLPNGLTARFDAPPTSPAYLAMTIALMRSLGAHIDTEPHDFATHSADHQQHHAHQDTAANTANPNATLRSITVRGWTGPGTRAGLPHDLRHAVEPDASGATYALALAAAIPGARVECHGLIHSLQGDARFADWLERMGATVQRDHAANTIAVTGGQSLRGIHADGSPMPDAAMTLAAIATLAHGPTTITGLRTLRVKETDRLAALRAELSKTGALVEILPDPDRDDESLRITPPPAGIERGPHTPTIDFHTYDDHRMAMACSIIAVARGNCRIHDPRCVAKTYPTYWADLAELLAGPA